MNWLNQATNPPILAELFFNNKMVMTLLCTLFLNGETALNLFRAVFFYWSFAGQSGEEPCRVSVHISLHVFSA